jgi:pilus assembly protein CpaD
MIADVLINAGVPKQMAIFQVRSEKNAGPDRVELSYSGYSIRVPTCGDWSGQAGFDPSNQSHTNFGCAYQRNTGLMLSNPGDLSVGGDSVERDAQASDRVIRTYRDGKSAGTPLPANEQGDFAGVK